MLKLLKTIVDLLVLLNQIVSSQYTLTPIRLEEEVWLDSNDVQRKFKISVPYSYSWEENNELRTWGTIKHRVFYAYDLPKGFYIE